MKAPARKGHPLVSFFHRVDKAINHASLGFMVILGALGLVWAVEPAPHTQLLFHQHIAAAPCSTVSVDLPAYIERAERRHAVYNVFLTNALGDVVYSYPQYTNVPVQKLSIEHLPLKVPDIKPGSYSVNIEMIYRFNPFKNGRTESRVATLEVN